MKKLGMTLTLDLYDHRSRNVLYLGSWVVLVVLGLLGIARRLGEHTDRLLLLIFLVYGLAVPTVFFTLARYKLSVEIIFLLFSGCALVGIEERVRSAMTARRDRVPGTAPHS
jgi:4-amino-4-deoxy-L-arabinose transferase-like glycosyltransferase